MSKTTGLSGATLIPVGATIERAYWAVPTHYSAGSEYPTEVEAIEAAIAAWETSDAAHAAFHGPNRLPLPQNLTVDLRWSLKWEPSHTTSHTSGTDTVIRRTHYASVAEAREHVARITKTGTRS